jgi:two-component sensor histidine kinase
MTVRKADESSVRLPDDERAGAISLAAALPAELTVPRGGLLGYRRYPVFSVSWWWRRSACFAAISGGVAALIAAGLWASQGDPHRALAALGYFAVGVTGMATCGPMLATWVRHRRWGGKRERIGVGIALLVGVAGASVIDGWASAGIEWATTPAAETVAAAPAAPPSLQTAWDSALGDGLALLLYALLGGGLALVRYFSEERELVELRHRREMAEAQKRQRELDARLGLLQAQVEPHFLFNTLASMRSLIGEDAAAAQRLLDALVTYLRAMIPRLREPAHLESTLGQQLELCTAYLEVMQGRMGGRLRVDVDVDARCKEERFPPLLLISLVENAVKHGIEPKRGAGQIALGAKEDGDELVVTVRDDGVGLREGMSGSGVGLRNVREALAARYGAAGRFSLTGLAEGGAEASLRVPRREKQAG